MRASREGARVRRRSHDPQSRPRRAYGGSGSDRRATVRALRSLDGSWVHGFAPPTKVSGTPTAFRWTRAAGRFLPARSRPAWPVTAQGGTDIHEYPATLRCSGGVRCSGRGATACPLDHTTQPDPPQQPTAADRIPVLSHWRVFRHARLFRLGRSPSATYRRPFGRLLGPRTTTRDLGTPRAV